jgi:hypothetical protein
LGILFSSILCTCPNQHPCLCYGGVLLTIAYTEWPQKMYTLFTHQYVWNKSVPGSNTSRPLPMGVPKGWCLSEETSYSGWSTRKHRNVVCSYNAGHWMPMVATSNTYTE